MFPNGNGRHARLMTDILMKTVLKRKPFVWDSQNIDSNNTARTKYVAALKKADNGDYSMLLDFVRSKKLN